MAIELYEMEYNGMHLRGDWSCMVDLMKHYHGIIYIIKPSKMNTDATLGEDLPGLRAIGDGATTEVLSSGK